MPLSTSQSYSFTGEYYVTSSSFTESLSTFSAVLSKTAALASKGGNTFSFNMVNFCGGKKRGLFLKGLLLC